MSNSTEYSPLIRFPDQSPSFVHGFEAGYIWALIESKIETFERLIHRCNIEVVKDMCEKGDYIFQIKGYVGFDEWGTILAIKKTILDN